jgi:hypothetical protein
MAKKNTNNENILYTKDGQPYESEGRSIIYDLCRQTFINMDEIRSDWKDAARNWEVVADSWYVTGECEFVQWHTIAKIYPRAHIPQSLIEESASKDWEAFAAEQRELKAKRDAKRSNLLLA